MHAMNDLSDEEFGKIMDGIQYQIIDKMQTLVSQAFVLDDQLTVIHTLLADYAARILVGTHKMAHTPLKELLDKFMENVTQSINDLTSCSECKKEKAH